MQPQQQMCEGRLARAAAAHESDGLTRQDLQIDVLESILICAGGITKRNIIEFNLTADARHFDTGLYCWVLFWFSIKHVVEPFECNIDLLKLAPQIDHAEDGSRHVSNEDVERHQLAHRQLTVDNQMGSIPEEED